MLERWERRSCEGERARLLAVSFEHSVGEKAGLLRSAFVPRTRRAGRLVLCNAGRRGGQTCSRTNRRRWCTPYANLLGPFVSRGGYSRPHRITAPERQELTLSVVKKDRLTLAVRRTSSLDRAAPVEKTRGSSYGTGRRLGSPVPLLWFCRCSKGRGRCVKQQ